MLLKTADITSQKQNKCSILIVEDGNVNFLLLKTMIEKTASFECDITRAENGKIAVDYCKDNYDLDLIFMDIQMPVMNGFEATLEIKKTHPSLPIIAQTAYTSKENRDRAIEVGCNDFINKPIRMENIAAVLSTYIQAGI